ncbi:MAG: hypothetical protein ACRDBP_09920, partial [Luteolibacter sp.]
YGKQREPISRVVALARAFPAPPAVNGSYSQTANLINVSVSPHVTIANGNNVYLDFSGASPSNADSAAYTVSNVLVDKNADVTTFTVRPISTEGTVTYTQTAASLVINVPDQHTFASGNNVYLDFTSVLPAGATPITDGLFTVTSAYRVSQNSNDHFTVPAPLAKRASYTQAAGNSTITLNVTGGHTYAPGDSVQIDFVTAGAPSGVFTVVSSTSPTLTVTGTDSPLAARSGNANVILPADIVVRNGALVATRDSFVVNRTNGSVALTFSDWGLNDTDNDLAQTPMNSPTVFNFFVPDYTSPGSLAQAGLITPEFQLTSDTTAIRQANFLYNGIFNDLHGIRGLSSFSSANRDIALDFRPWMGEGPGGLPWAHNSNLGALVDKLNALLMAGQLPSTGTNSYTNPRSIVNAKAVITSYAQSLPYDKAVTTVTTSALATVTVAAHGYTTGDTVTIAGVSGTGFTNGTHPLTVTGPNTFTVPVTCTTVTANLSSATATVSGVAKPITGLGGFCSISVTSHGFNTGQPITISGVTGGAFTPAINGSHVVVNNGNTNSFLIPVTRTSSTSQSVTNARIAIPGGFSDLVRDRIKGIVHLLVTSPDFTIQK